MRAEHDLYRVMVRQADGHAQFMVTPEGEIGTWNLGVERLLGYAEAEFVGQPLACIFTPADREAGWPVRELQTAARVGHVSDDRWHLRRDGRQIWVNGTLSALRGAAGELLGFVKVLVDRTQDAQTRAALRESEERFELAFHASPAPTFIIPLDGRAFQNVNESFVRLTGYRREELLGRTPDELELVVDRPARNAFVARLRESGDVPPVEFPIRTKSGEVRHCLLAGRAIRIGGESCSLCSLVDVSEQKRTELDVRQALESVLHDTTWLTQRVMERLSQMRQGRVEGATVTELTERERQIIGLLAEGKSNLDIAQELNLSPQTVRNYISRVYEKIGASTRAEAIVWARQRGLGRS